MVGDYQLPPDVGSPDLPSTSLYSNKILQRDNVYAIIIIIIKRCAVSVSLKKEAEIAYPTPQNSTSIVYQY